VIGASGTQRAAWSVQAIQAVADTLNPFDTAIAESLGVTSTFLLVSLALNVAAQTDGVAANVQALYVAAGTLDSWNKQLTAGYVGNGGNGEAGGNGGKGSHGLGGGGGGPGGGYRFFPGAAWFVGLR